MKKYWKLALATVISAFALSFAQRFAGWASTEGSYIYHSFILPNSTDTLSVAGTSAFTGVTTIGVAGTGTLNSGLSVAPVKAAFPGILVTPSIAVGAQTPLLGIYASSTVYVASTYESVISSNGKVLLTSTPNIATTTVSGAEVADGTWLVITSTVGNGTTGGLVFQSEGGLTSSGLRLGAATRNVFKFVTLTLQYNAAVHVWQEIAYINDNN